MDIEKGLNYQLAYRSAIELNNSGITLLVKRCYLQAQETLRDSVDAMRIIVGSLRAPLQLEDSLDDTRRRATFRLFHPRPMGPVATFHVQDVEQDYFEPILLNEENHFVLLPIRTVTGYNDDGYCDSSDSADKIDFETAIILHNFAIANWCVAAFTLNTGAADGFRHSAIQVLQMSQAILEHLSIIQEDDFIFQRIGGVTITVLHTLLRILDVTGSVAATEAVKKKIQYLLTDIQIVKTAWSTMATKGIVAAAA